MSRILLYIAPGSCSRVPLIALVEAGADFETSVVRFMAGEHKSSAYKRLNPKGKVPALIVDGESLTENVAILSYPDQRFPAAGLLPVATTPLEAARQIADLCLCAATLHRSSRASACRRSSPRPRPREACGRRASMRCANIFNWSTIAWMGAAGGMATHGA